jgi:hypothetical protein
VAVPVTWRLHASPVAPATKHTGPVRGAGELTISLDPKAGFSLFAQSATDFRQDLEVYSTPDRIDLFHASVVATEAGAPPDIFRRPDLPGTKRITVGGHDALDVAQEQPYPGGTFRSETLHWTDPSGRTIDVSDVNPAHLDHAMLLRVAAAVRVGKPRPVTMPFRLGPLPPGLHLNSISSNRSPLPSPELRFVYPATVHVVAIQIEVMDKKRTPTVPKFHDPRPALPVAGRQAWSDTYRIPQDVLTVDAGPCWIRFTKSNQLTAAQLHEIADHTTYLDCTRESTWTAPVG